MERAFQTEYKSLEVGAILIYLREIKKKKNPGVSDIYEKAEEQPGRKGGGAERSQIIQDSEHHKRSLDFILSIIGAINGFTKKGITLSGLHFK